MPVTSFSARIPSGPSSPSSAERLRALPSQEDRSRRGPHLRPLPEGAGSLDSETPLPRSAAGEGPWRAFVKTYEGFLRECARATLRALAGWVCREEVEDAVQDVYVRLLSADCRALATFRGTQESQVLAFLARTAENLVIDMVRRDATQKRGRLIPHRPLHMLPAEDEALCSPDLTPEERMLILEECQVAIHHAVPRGARKGRRNLRLLRQSAVEGMTSREIAEEWAQDGGEDLSPSAVDSALFRMRARMRTHRQEELPLCA